MTDEVESNYPVEARFAECMDRGGLAGMAGEVDASRELQHNRVGGPGLFCLAAGAAVLLLTQTGEDLGRDVVRPALFAGLCYLLCRTW